IVFFFFFQAEDGIRDLIVTGVQTCALPISRRASTTLWISGCWTCGGLGRGKVSTPVAGDSKRTGSSPKVLKHRRPWVPSISMRRSEEHTSELQSRSDLVCRLLLEKKKKYTE